MLDTSAANQVRASTPTLCIHSKKTVFLSQATLSAANSANVDQLTLTPIQSILYQPSLNTWQRSSNGLFPANSNLVGTASIEPLPENKTLLSFRAAGPGKVPGYPLGRREAECHY